MKTKLMTLSLILMLGLIIAPAGVAAEPSSNSHRRIMDLLNGVEDGTRVNIWFGPQVVQTDEVNFLWHAFFFTADDKGTQNEFLPIDFEFFVDGVEVKVKFSMVLFPNSGYYTDDLEPVAGERSDPIVFY